MAGKPLVQAVQEAIYRVRWVDAYGKDGTLATDEAIAEAVVKVIDEEG